MSKKKLSPEEKSTRKEQRAINLKIRNNNLWKQRMVYKDDKIIKYNFEGIEIIISAEDKLLFEDKNWRKYKAQQKSEKYYIAIMENGVYTALHRIVIGAKKGEIVDHINRNPSDCRRENLRLVTVVENNLNRSLSDSKEGCKLRGVRLNNSGKGKKYKSEIKINGKNKTVGYFNTEQEAHEAFMKMAKNREQQYRESNLILN